MVSVNSSLKQYQEKIGFHFKNKICKANLKNIGQIYRNVFVEQFNQRFDYNFGGQFFKIIIFSMSEKQEEKLQTLDQLFNYNAKVNKACTIGLIIDVTSAYYDEDKSHYIKRLKIIDSSFNMTKPINGLKFGYCTVSIFAKRQDQLPDVRSLGDIIYLRRFAFEKYNDNFQSHSHKKDFCYWILLDGNSDIESFSNYQSSRLNLNIEDEKFRNLLAPLQELRSFGRTFLENNSIAKIIPSGHTPKDEDWIVKLTLKGSHGRYRVQRGQEEITLFDCPTNMQIGQWGKLRSVARVDEVDGEQIVVKNNFTSLVRIHDWTFDAQNAIKNSEKITDEDDAGLYTDLSALLSTPIASCANKTFWVKCEIFSISAATFVAAVKYYDSKKNQLLDIPHKGTEPVYKLSLMCQDTSLKNKFAEVWVFSYDGKGSNFVKGLNLKELNQFSSTVQEDNLYHRRYDELLEAENVIMMVECLNDGKGNRLLRAVQIK